TPPTVSLTISCQIRICIGYARLSAPTVNAITGSAGLSQVLASAAPTNLGRSSVGMPSLRGPPLLIALKDTLCWSTSLFQPSPLPGSPPPPRGGGGAWWGPPPRGAPLPRPRGATSTAPARAAPAAAFAFIAPGGSAARAAAGRLAAA